MLFSPAAKHNASPRLSLRACAAIIMLWAALPATPAVAQNDESLDAPATPATPATDRQNEGESQAAATDPPSDKGDYVPATQLLPKSVAGMIRIPHFPRFCDAFDQTHLGQLIDSPAMQPFVEAQRASAKNYFESIGNRIGLRLEDLYEVASGEVVVAWLPFEKDRRRPFAITVVADVREKLAEAREAIETIDTDLKNGGWQRTDVTHADQTVRVYNTKPRPGQLKVEQIALTLDDTRLIAADRDSVVMDLLDAIAGEGTGESLSQQEDFSSVLRKASEAIGDPIRQGGGTISAEYFAKPFQMARILRETFEVDRGNQVDIIKLLENQGFDAIRSVGGILALAGEKYDLLHRGFVLADQSEFDKAARMLALSNESFEEIPAWIDPEVATLNRLNLNIEEAFWASESLINEAFGDEEIFRGIIEGIRDDEEGPQIDLEKNVLPNLDDRILLLTDNTVPADLRSERLLLAIKVRDGDAIATAIRKAMEVEPDAKKLDVVEGIEIWQVERTETVDEFDEELFGDLNLDFEDEPVEETPPLLENWAIALVPKGPASDAPYLVFSSHSEWLIETAKRMQAGQIDGLGSAEEIQTMIAALKELGCENPAFNRLVRTRLSLRAKYQLLRKGNLKESDSILSALYRRLAEDEGGEPDPLNATKLPPLEEIEQFLPNGGSFLQSHADGWSLTSFLLK